MKFNSWARLRSQFISNAKEINSYIAFLIPTGYTLIILNATSSSQSMSEKSTRRSRVNHHS